MASRAVVDSSFSAVTKRYVQSLFFFLLHAAPHVRIRKLRFWRPFPEVSGPCVRWAKIAMLASLRIPFLNLTSTSTKGEIRHRTFILGTFPSLSLVRIEHPYRRNFTSCAAMARINNTPNGVIPLPCLTGSAPPCHVPCVCNAQQLPSKSTNYGHSQAAESLSMNGRALNDRAIEVAPSSSRVLDRAAHSQPSGGPPLLTPFPPSKNRPRPGDWTCPSCGFSNFQRRTACFRCSFPAMGASGPDPYSQPYGMQAAPYGGAQFGHPGMMGGGHMHGGSFGGGMGGMGGSSGRGGIVPFRAGDWKCGNEGCGYHNFAKNVSCLRCGASRSNAAVIAESGMTSFPGQSYGGPPQVPMQQPPPANYGGGSQQSFDSSAYGAMQGPPAGFGSQSFGPPSSYNMPSGMPQPSPYMAGGYGQMASNGGIPAQAGFDSRTEQAFNQGNAGAQAGAGAYANGAYGPPGGYGNDGTADPFSFLSAGMGQLGINEGDSRRNGAGASKSPQ